MIVHIVFCIRISTDRFRLQMLEMNISLVKVSKYDVRLKIESRIRFAQRTRYKSALSFLTHHFFPVSSSGIDDASEYASRRVGMRMGRADSYDGVSDEDCLCCSCCHKK